MKMEKVKKKLKTLCRPGYNVRPEFAWPESEDTPFEVRFVNNLAMPLLISNVA
jgi:hypothetical protein